MDKYSNEMFQKNLKRLRELSCLTQGELADGLFVVRSSISNYENGNREPTLTRLQQIASYFDVSVSYLVGDADDDNKELNVNKIMLSKYISKDNYLDVSELTLVNRIVLVEHFKFLVSQQRIKSQFNRKIEK